MKNTPRQFWISMGALYLVVQSLAALVWWFLLFTRPEIRPYFRPVATPDSALLAFLLPDLVLFVGAALVAAWWLVREPQHARTPLLLHFGGALYAALYCLNQTLLTGEAVLASVVMLTSALIGAVLLWLVGRQ